jgi:GT2 family glycosyltransferase
VFDRFQASFVVSGRSIRDKALLTTIESIRAQDCLEWECVLFLEEEPHPDELVAVSSHSPRFRAGDGDPWNPWKHLRSDLAINVLVGTELTPNALRNILSASVHDVALMYGDRTGWARPEWSPIRYRNDHYFGDVVVMPQPSPIRTQCVRIPTPLTLGERGSFPPVPKAVAMSTAGSARTAGPKTIDVIIPTAGRTPPNPEPGRAMVLDLVESLGNHENVAITVVLDNGAPSEVSQELASMPDLRVIPFDKPFNFSQKCNVGAMTSEADVLFFLNDDMLCRSQEWPTAIRRSLSFKSVGAVGGLLIDETGHVRCAGHGNAPVPHLFGTGLDPDDPANRTTLRIEREVGGLSGACLAIDRNVFLSVGGFCEQLPFSYNDVDLGFKVLDLGLHLLYSPEICFFHWESASRNPVISEEETMFIRARWGRQFEVDRFAP